MLSTEFIQYKDLIREKLQQFEGIGLKELDRVKLLNRVDTKFIFNVHLLPSILKKLSKSYYILDIKGVRLNEYASIYFDTPDLFLYELHHNDRKNRYKMRYRKYVDSGLSFFEIKFKNNKGRTIKKRVRTQDIWSYLDEEAIGLIHKASSIDETKYFHSIDINFARLTLAEKNYKERATIDLGLNYVANGKEVEYEQLVIAELKQEKADRRSPLTKCLKEHGILPYKVSKYCLGILSCYDDLKYNRFKPKLRTVQKIQAMTFDEELLTL